MRLPAQLSTVFDFGPHTGNTVEEVIEKDPTYIERLIDNTSADFRLAKGAFAYFIEFMDSLDG